MRPPRGESTQTRQSPSSSRTRSMTMVLASGTARAAASWSRRYSSRFSAARASRSCSRVSRSTAAAGGELEQIVHQPSDREPELERAAGPIAFPEGHLPRLAGRGRHQHAVVGDLLDAPRRGAEHERLAGAALEDHLLVELADARRAGPGADEEDAEQAAVRNGAAVGNRHALGAFARADLAGDAVPGDARTELGEFIGGIAPRQHVEHPFEHGAAQLRERRRPADRGEQRFDVPVVHRRHRHDVLRDDVERVAGITGGLDRAVVHRLRDRRARHQVAAELREDDALG